MSHLIIISEILYNKELTLNEKIVLSVVLTKSSGELIELSNEEIANVLGVSKTTASGIVNSLNKKGYIEISYEYVKDSEGNPTKGISCRKVKKTKF